MKTRNIIGLVLIAAVMGYLLINFSSSTSIYTDFDSAKASNEEAHVVAKWVKRDQAHYNENSGVFSFYLQDSLNTTQLVEYNDPKPTNFDHAEKVVVVGKYEGEVFHAKKILMKCPSKYETKETEI